MLVLYTIYVLIFICIMTIVGQLNINPKKKRIFIIIASLLFNAFMGYSLIIVCMLSSIYFSNIPKGLLGMYTVPIVEHWLNIFIGVFAIATYLACLIPINIYMCEKSKIKETLYLKINIIAAVAGLLIYLIS